MLVLSRKKNESIVIDGGIVIEVLQISRDQIRVGVTAPAAVKVLRGELRPFSQQPAAEPRNQPAVSQDSDRTTQFVISGNRLQAARELPTREIAVREPELIFQASSPGSSLVSKPAGGTKSPRSSEEFPTPRLVRCG